MTAQACNTAAYLSTDIIRASIGKVVSDINGAQTLLNIALGVVALVPGIGLVADIGIGAAVVLNNAISATTTATYSAALDDAVLWARVTCAIYVAIAGVGYVDASNNGAVSTALGAVNYSNADVVAGIKAYYDALGLTGVQAAQSAGALFQGDCSACGAASGVDIGDGAAVGTLFDGHTANIINPPLFERHTYTAVQRSLSGSTAYSFSVVLAPTGAGGYAACKVQFALTGFTPFGASASAFIRSTEGGDQLIGAGQAFPTINPDWHYSIIQGNSTTPCQGTIAIVAYP